MNDTHVTRWATIAAFRRTGRRSAMRLTSSALLCLPLLVAVGCDEQQKSQPSTTVQAPIIPNALQTVDNNKVCMVTDRFMRSPQIPVNVEGRTYYGCCEGCKARLTNDPSVRSAIDPVTRHPVDKASAVIGADASGAVLYFENEGSFTKYYGGGGSARFETK